ncbi:MAG: COG4315 family predicted lipoprotein [Propionibacteriaceae bacterium]
MTRSKPIRFLAGAAALPLVALAVAGCGGGSSSNNSASAATAPPKTTSGQPATVGTASGGNLGTILVDSQGRTLYLFEKDSGTKSACFGACATNWPPLRDSGKSTAGSGLNASLLGTTPRSDGKPQVTYNGHPLYTFVMDTSPGQTNGQGVTAFGGSWFTLNSAGNQVTAAQSSTTTSGSSGGGAVGY